MSAALEVRSLKKSDSVISFTASSRLTASISTLRRWTSRVRDRSRAPTFAAIVETDSASVYISSGKRVCTMA